MRERWGWGLLLAAGLGLAFLGADLAYLGANATKIVDGGWFPLLIAASVYTLMATWKRGRDLLAERLPEKSVPLTLLLADFAADPPPRVPGTAVFMSGNPEGTPVALVYNLTHNKVLHERIVFLSVLTEEIPHVARGERVEIEELGHGAYRVIARYGFMEDPDVPRVLELCRERGLDVPLEETTFFLGRETILATARPGMGIWREKLFGVMSRNALRATAYFRIPADRVFEVGAQVEL
jgi:KUP system potassium uptake protein